MADTGFTRLCRPGKVEQGTTVAIIAPTMLASDDPQVGMKGPIRFHDQTGLSDGFDK